MPARCASLRHSPGSRCLDRTLPGSGPDDGLYRRFHIPEHALMARLRSDFWVSAYLRRCGVEGVEAVLRKRGAAEAGAIFVKVDHLDGTASLFGPAPQSFLDDSGERMFAPVMQQVTP